MSLRPKIFLSAVRERIGLARPELVAFYLQIPFHQLIKVLFLAKRFLTKCISTVALKRLAGNYVSIIHLATIILPKSHGPNLFEPKLEVIPSYHI